MFGFHRILAAIWATSNVCIISSLALRENVTDWESSDGLIPYQLVPTDMSTILDVNKHKSKTLSVHYNHSSVTSPDNSIVPSAAHQAKSYILYRVGQVIHTFWLPLVVLVGWTGNLLSFAVMTRKQNIKISCCIYMAMLAIADSGVLCLGAIYWTATIVYPRKRYRWECKIIDWLFVVLSNYGVILLISMTIDRLIAVRFPLRSVTVCTPKRAKLISAISLIIIMVYNIPQLYLGDVFEGRTCQSLAVKSPLVEIYSWFLLFTSSFVPFTIILILNTLIIKTLKQRNALFKILQEHSYNHSSVDQKDISHVSGPQQHQKYIDTSLIVMLLGVTFTFLTLTSPFYIRSALFQLIDLKQTPKSYALYMFIFQLSNKLFFTNCGVNFFLYCLAGSKFRRETWALLHCWRKK